MYCNALMDLMKHSSIEKCMYSCIFKGKLPAFIAYREELWKQFKKERDDWLAAQVSKPIKITLPDGKIIDGESWKSTPYGVAVVIRFDFNVLFVLLYCSMNGNFFLSIILLLL